MAEKYLFLDIDGVLNNHVKMDNGYCGIDARRMRLLGQLVDRVPRVKIYLVSAWRYMILSGDMTLAGFKNMLLTHGASRATVDAFWAYSPEDENPDDVN